MCLETLSGNGDDLPRSLRLDPREHWQEQFVRRALLSIEHETVSGLYDPEAKSETSNPIPCTIA